jgi:serine/threonine protein kinase
MGHADNRLPLASGSEIGVYQVRSHVGGDLISLSYEAWNSHLNSRVILREFFPSGIASRDAGGQSIVIDSGRESDRFAAGLTVFLDETDRLADIEHEAVQQVLNGLRFNNSGYQVLTVEAGFLLSRRLADKAPFSATELQAIFFQLLSGLREIHDASLVHGRVCPANIVLGSDGRPVLINFSSGLLEYARTNGDLADLIPAGYSRPEQDAISDLTASTDDLYGVGATLFHCLTGRVPEPGSERLEVDGGSQSQHDWIQAVNWMLRSEAADRPRDISAIETFLEAGAEQKQKGRRESLVGIWGGRGLRGISAMTWLGSGGLLVLAVLLIVWMVGSVPDADPESLTVASNADGSSPRTGALELHTGDDPLLDAQISSTVTEGSEIPLIVDRMVTDSVQALSGLNGKAPGDSEDDRLLNTAVEPQALLPEVMLEVTVEVDAVVLARQPGGDGRSQSVWVAGLLEQGERNLQLFNLTTPENDNAYLNFQAVLKIDPENDRARAGIEDVIIRYGWLIEWAIREGGLQYANLLKVRAERISGDLSILSDVLDRLEQAKTASQRADRI